MAALRQDNGLAGMTRAWHWLTVRGMRLPTVAACTVMLGALISTVATGFDIWKINTCVMTMAYWAASYLRAETAKSFYYLAVADTLAAVADSLHRGQAIDLRWVSRRRVMHLSRDMDSDWYPPMDSAALDRHLNTPAEYR